jgi:DNA end-binding protein Ku
MAERPIWRGHLRLALVSCPVALITAHRERGNLRFHYINPETGNRIRMVTVDAQSGQELERRDLTKGYEFRKDHYVLMGEEDFETARVDSSSTVTIDKFVPAGSIDPIFFDSSYYMVPDGDAGEDVYAVLREAIGKSKVMALSRVVISRRERPVAIMPMGKGLVLHTLHEESDVTSAESAFAGVPTSKADPAMVRLAEQLIERQLGEYDPADVEDRYEARLREVIEAKIRGEGFEPEAEPEAETSNVIDLMAALKASLKGGGPAEAKAEPRKAARKEAAPAAKPKAKAGAKAGPARKRA